LGGLLDKFSLAVELPFILTDMVPFYFKAKIYKKFKA
jgi:hypothetical protein